MELGSSKDRSRADQAACTHEALARLTRNLRALRLPAGLTHERLSALAAVIGNEPVSISTLAAIEGVRVATISRMVSGLEGLGLVERHHDVKDGRGVLVTSTAKGQRAYEAAIACTFELVLTTISELDPEQLATVKHLLSANGEG